MTKPDLNSEMKILREQLIAVQVANVRLQEEKKRAENDLNNLLKAQGAKKEEILNPTLHETQKKATKDTWEHIVDEMAHSINTDVFIAVNYLAKQQYSGDENIIKALAHTKNIRDLISLFMWYMKRGELNKTGNIVEVNLAEAIRQQISEIMAGISTLRISSDEHEEKLLKMDIPVSCDTRSVVKVPEEIKEAVVIVLKDLIKNAIKNTAEENPVCAISISLYANNAYQVEIRNNSIISDEYADWFNGVKFMPPVVMSKSSKVGLRVVKMWNELLKLNAKIFPDKVSGFTITRILFPKEITYEK